MFSDDEVPHSAETRNEIVAFLTMSSKLPDIELALTPNQKSFSRECIIVHVTLQLVKEQKD